MRADYRYSTNRGGVAVYLGLVPVPALFHMSAEGIEDPREEI